MMVVLAVLGGLAAHGAEDRFPMRAHVKDGTLFFEDRTEK